MKIDPYRRELQRSYLKAINTKLNPVERAATPSPAGLPEGVAIPRVITSGDEKPMYRTELRALAASITAAMAKTTDHETKAHLEASRDEIAKILDPKFAPAAPAAPAASAAVAARGKTSQFVNAARSFANIGGSRASIPSTLRRSRGKRSNESSMAATKAGRRARRECSA